MPDSNTWVDLVATASLVLSIAAFGTSAIRSRRKLRLQLRAIEGDLAREVEGLRGLFDQSMRSRLQVNATLGRKGGAEDVFLQIMNAHSHTIEELSKLRDDIGVDPRREKNDQIKDRIIQRASEAKRAIALRDTLHGYLAEDDRDREWLRTHAHQHAENVLVATLRGETAERLAQR